MLQELKWNKTEKKIECVKDGKDRSKMKPLTIMKRSFQKGKCQEGLFDYGDRDSS